jgi:hypothetical protein
MLILPVSVSISEKIGFRHRVPFDIEEHFERILVPVTGARVVYKPTTDSSTAVLQSSLNLHGCVPAMDTE